MSSKKIQSLRNILERKKGKRIELKKSINTLELEIETSMYSMQCLEEARSIIRLIGLQIQQELQYHISDITSLALEGIFKEPYKLLLDFVERRNKTECDIFFERDGEKFKPLDSSGGGAVDVAAFALRVASWSMQKPRPRNLIILDEPMRFLSAEYQENASLMIKEISSKLGIQFIIITHNTTLASFADKVFEVSIKNGKSLIK